MRRGEHTQEDFWVKRVGGLGLLPRPQESPIAEGEMLWGEHPRSHPFLLQQPQAILTVIISPAFTLRLVRS